MLTGISIPAVTKDEIKDVLNNKECKKPLGEGRINADLKMTVREIDVEKLSKLFTNCIEKRNLESLESGFIIHKTEIQ